MYHPAGNFGLVIYSPGKLFIQTEKNISVTRDTTRFMDCFNWWQRIDKK